VVYLLGLELGGKKMAYILKYSKKQLEKTLKDFVKKESIDSNDIPEWIRLINDFIYEFGLKSEVSEEGKLSITTNKEEQAVIEKMMSTLEGSKMSFNYIFDGNITYIEE
jgi:hypothetical protein